MEHQYIWWLAVTSTLYLCLTADLTEGRCEGMWAIHACLGGNGKRSQPIGPSLQNSILFKRLQESQQYPDELNQPGLLHVNDIPVLQNGLNPSAKRVQNLLLDMALKQQLADQPKELSRFGRVRNRDEW